MSIGNVKIIEEHILSSLQIQVLNLVSKGNMCVESGSYLLNFKGCVVCSTKDTLNIIEHNKLEDENGEEIITYKRKWSDLFVLEIVWTWFNPFSPR